MCGERDSYTPPRPRCSLCGRLQNKRRGISVAKYRDASGVPFQACGDCLTARKRAGQRDVEEVIPHAL